MSRFKIILTSDYEVWGDGSGCVENCVISPADEMMKVAESQGARITFFFDVCEYWAFEQVEKEGRFIGDYRPATLMKSQLQDAIKKGHDVQLHFHPQWLNFEFISNQKWKLDYRYWALPKVVNYHNDEWNLDKLILKGVDTLNSMFREVKPDYSCKAFRAGAWSIQPENQILDALNKYGIKIDSTVAPGKYFDDGLTRYDFTDCPSRPLWKMRNSLKDDEGEITEIPISTVEIGRSKSIYFKLLKLPNFKKFYPERCEKGKINAVIKKTKRLSDKSVRMLNFSDASTFSEMKFITEKIFRKFASIDKEPDQSIPIVAISHPKTYGYNKSFDQYLSWINEGGKAEFETLSGFHDKYLMKNGG